MNISKGAGYDILGPLLVCVLAGKGGRGNKIVLKSVFHSFSVQIYIFWRKNIGAKAARKMLIKLTLGFR